MLQQLTIYAENKKGTLEQITRILLERNINILGSMTDDGAEYGVNRMVVSDPAPAMEELKKAGYVCSVKDVIGVEVEDKVGNLNALLKTLLQMNINVHYLYLSFNRDSGLPIMVFHTEDIWEVEDGLRNKGYRVV
ncbi:MAG TPA: amino acid-binding protein [Lachnospiraceae bacterium]|nr:amino acid-binding protein [Lachnospiraceae bacterium]